MTSYETIEKLESQAMFLDEAERFANNQRAAHDPNLSSLLHTFNTAYWAHEWALREGYADRAKKEAAKMAKLMARLAESGCYPYLAFSDDLCQYVLAA